MSVADPNAPPQDGAPSKWHFRWKFSALGWRFVGVMLAVCAAFAGIATIMQIWAEIHSEDSAHIAAQDQISQNFAPLVASALMDGRASDVTDAVRLILSLNPVHDANIILAHGDKAELAAVWGSARHFESQVFPLVHRGEDVGTLNVIWSPKTASTNIAATIQRHLFVNLLESMIIGMLMLVIFDRLAARHLKAIADQVRSTPWMDTDNPRWLNCHPMLAFLSQIHNRRFECR